MLRNPAYKGMAAFGKNKIVSKKPQVRPHKGHPLHSKIPYSVERVPKEKWILIPVPAIIDESLFYAVQEQLEENKKLKRARISGVKYLLQGLVVCNLCEYGYHGNTSNRSKNRYYSCGGTKIYANRDRSCYNKSIQADTVEELVWREIKYLLNHPFYLKKEYQRRIKELEKYPCKNESDKLNADKLKIQKNISRLIDSYTEGLIEKSEFEPRIKNCKKHLGNIEQNLSQLMDNQTKQLDLQIVTERIEEFSLKVKENLGTVDWKTKRNIILALVKRIEIGEDNVNIVFRIEPAPVESVKNPLFEDCRTGVY